MAGLGHLRMESLAFALQARWTEVHVKSTFSQPPCKRGHPLTQGEIESGGNDKHKQIPSVLLSVHLGDTMGRELRSKCCKLLQISHCTKLRGRMLTARLLAQSKDALANLILIQTLLGRVFFFYFMERLSDLPKVTQLGNVGCK